MINFAEDNVYISDFEDVTLTYEPNTTRKLVIQKMNNGGYERIPVVYNKFEILPVIMKVDDTVLEFKREVLEFDMILPTGIGNDTPRRTPTELIYKGKKMKHKFTTD